MGLSQTKTQNAKNVRVGAAVMEYSTDGGSSWTLLGAGDNFNFTDNFTPFDASPDNVTTPLDGMASTSSTVGFTWWERDFAKMHALYAGLTNYTASSVTPVAGETFTAASGDWVFDRPVELPYNMASAPTINSVTGGTDGALVENVDYVVFQQSNGRYAISIIDSTTVTTAAQDIVVDFDYTPIGTEKLTYGGNSLIDRIQVRFTSRSPAKADAADIARLGSGTVGDGIFRTTRYTWYYAKLNAGASLTFPQKDATDPVHKFPIEFLCEEDPARAVGDQLKSEEDYLELQSAVTIS